MGKNDMRDIPTLVPHQDYGDSDCCGIIMPAERDDQTDSCATNAALSSAASPLMKQNPLFCEWRR